MPIVGLVAGVLCASVGWVVVTQGLRTTRSQREEQRANEQALVTDCLANVDRVIDMPAVGRPEPLRVIALRPFEPVELDHVIDLSGVRPRHAPALASSAPAQGAIILEPPSPWRVPRMSAPRSAAATA